MTVSEIYSQLGGRGYSELESQTIARELWDEYEKFSTGSVEIILKHFPCAGEYVSFNGQNCEDARYNDDDPECRGWDGYSRRCDCGNRRVSWVVEGMWAYGDAH